ncbi:hypothetical protein BU17DRAFT_71454 [Hysterangium stoloniferum]|nr:hypothetical protein BU17DRAFT_71454 [Hysterangium stoloniferum]
MWGPVSKRPDVSALAKLPAFFPAKVDLSTKTVDLSTKTVDLSTKTVDLSTKTVDLSTKTVDSSTKMLESSTKTGESSTETVGVVYKKLGVFYKNWFGVSYENLDGPPKKESFFHVLMFFTARYEDGKEIDNPPLQEWLTLGGKFLEGEKLRFLFDPLPILTPQFTSLERHLVSMCRAIFNGCTERTRHELDKKSLAPDLPVPAPGLPVIMKL